MGEKSADGGGNQLAAPFRPTAMQRGQSLNEKEVMTGKVYDRPAYYSYELHGSASPVKNKLD